jgi:glycosyltransferase involved in cell wall biosynthesis
MVVIDEAPLDDADMLALYRSAQALVLPTRGEGFNLPAAEALAMGLPVIVTGYGAHLDFCTRTTALLVPYHFSQSLSHVKSVDACWVEPDILALGAQMRQLQTEVMTNTEGLARRRQAGIDYVRPTYTWRQSARAVMKSVHWLEDRRTTAAGPALRRLALLSPWKTRCGIAEYSHKLLADIEASFNLRIFCDTRTAPNAAQSVYKTSWEIGGTESVCATLDAIASEPFEVLLVQHQPSLFSLTDALCERLLAIHDQGTVVLLELHSTLPLLHECRMSVKALAALRNLDRILVHKLEDLNHLLALGLADNVLLLPHGVVQPANIPTSRSAWGIGEDELVLASFGFLLPHKGVDTLIDCIKPLARASKRRVRLLGLNSTLDSRSEDMLTKCMNQARELGVDQQITWITDFRPIDECVQLLGMADYIVFPYRETRESASGAVTIGLAALKPVLVSPLPIFSDLSDTTYRLTGEGVNEIVNAVCELEKAPERRQQLITTQRAWLAERNWSRVSSRLDAVMHGLLLDRQLEASVAARREGFMADHAKVRVAQLLVDVSELYFRDAKTGIQRVVRSILSELLATPPPGFEVCPVYGSADQGYRYTDKFSAKQRASHPSRDEKAVKVEDGDVFLGLDLSAHLFPKATAELKKFRLAGARVYFVVYDIIPLLYPQFTVAGMTAAFEVWLQSLAQEADGLVCISAAVADDVKAWLAKHAKTCVLPAVLHFHLGADIESSAPSMGLPENAPALLEKIKQQPSFLMVGTIEPRKAQAQALAAFEQLWREGVTVQLVLVGKEGWLMEEFCQKVRAHPEFGHRLLWLEGISDEFLEQVYAASSCLLAASEAEGFGLPLIEAAQHRLPIMARDIGVFREVAGAHASYFSGLQPENLARAIDAWLALYRAGDAPSSSSMPWLTWQQSTRRLLDIVLKA